MSLKKEFISYIKHSIFLTHPDLDKKSKNIFFIMNSVYLGFLISLFYGFITSVIIYFVSKENFDDYIHSFFIDYNCFITGGLAFALTFQIFKTQKFIPELLYKVFEDDILDNKKYKLHKKTYYSFKNSIRIISIHIILSFGLFHFAKFPHKNIIAESSMIVFGCVIFSCGVYVGRKIFYLALMLQDVEEIQLKRDIFSKNELGGVTTYVNIVTTFTVLSVWLVIKSYYYGPFLYNSIFGNSIKIFMFYPVIIAMPVLVVFNYYPRNLVRQLYARSIDIKIHSLNGKLKKKKKITEFERIQYINEVDKISREELKYKLRLALNELPLIVTIVIMIISLFV